MSHYRILLTGAREWDDWESIESALHVEACLCISLDLEPVLVHGKAKGADEIAGEIWSALPWGMEEYPADYFTDPKSRNDYMVGLGADVCLAFALKWASGTGHCARSARRAGILTIDHGVNTE